ncbi:MAG TPA: hypothetical protein VFD43_04580 [Planctomycetota bacterium]|nr:hypothetical protein [Planctomycetota bacterium]
MLIPSLLLMIAACPLQDAAAPAAQGAAPAEAVPSETPENVRTYLEEAQGLLYDPQSAGLTSLAFDVAVDLPQLGRLGTVHVTWAAGETAKTTFTAEENPALPQGMPAGMLEAQANATAQQLLNGMLNRTIGTLLDEGVATMAGVQDNLVAVSHHHPAMAAQGVTSQLYLFDDEGLLKKSKTAMEQPGMTMSIVQTYSWKPAAEGIELLVADSQSVEAKVGPMTQSSQASFAYTRVGPIVLPIRIATSSKGPMSGEQVIAASNLVVNGTAAPIEPAPAAADPAASAPRPAGG